MSANPEVTVVIPTKDRWDLLSTAALPSALAQEDVDIEILVVDDGSLDGTKNGLGRLEDERVRVVTHERPRGVARARNAGIEAARGHWIAFLDDDDLWHPRKLRLELDVVPAAGAILAYGGAAAIGENRSWLYSLTPWSPLELARELLTRNVLWGGSSNVIARTTVLRDLGGFDEGLFQLCDWDLWIRLALAGPAAASPEVVVGCIVHPRSMLLVSEDDVMKEFDYLERKHHAAATESGTHFDRRLFMRWLALGHRRAGRRWTAAKAYLACVVATGDPGSIARAGLALVGPPPNDAAPTLRRRSGGATLLDSAQEPPWLARYRDDRKSIQAISKASSPREV